jgi:hypothetical protein
MSEHKTKVTIVGGGVAALEAMIALRNLAEERVAIKLVTPTPEWSYRPLAVAEPFGDSSLPGRRDDPVLRPLPGLVVPAGTLPVRARVLGFLEHPLGDGPGTAGLASIRDPSSTQLNENYYLQIASEVGILGLAVFLAILVIVARRLYLVHKNNPIAVALLASFAGLAVTNFLVHIWSNQAVAYTWWGLAGLFIHRLKS